MLLALFTVLAVCLVISNAYSLGYRGIVPRIVAKTGIERTSSTALHETTADFKNGMTIEIGTGVYTYSKYAF
jgi:hypothetical protein